MDHFEIEICKVEEPVSLMVVQVLGLTEVGQVLMIGENLNWEGGALEVMVPGVEATDDGKEFSVVDVVVVFSGGEQLGKVGTGVPVSIGVSL